MYPCVMNAGLTFMLRAAWFGARLGKAAIPVYKKAFDEQDDWMAIMESGLALGAIGLRHSGTLAEVKRALSGHGEPIVGEGPATNERTRTNVAHLVLETLEKADERGALAMTIGREFASTMSSALPEGHALRYAKPEDVPDDVARTALLSFDGDINLPQLQMLTVHAMVVAAKAQAEDFYFPRDYVRAWFGQWAPEETLERLKRFATKKEEPVRRAPEPGRNDPCPCGSGKKYKKCHGGPTPPAPAETA